MSVRDMLMAAAAGSGSGSYRYWRIFIETNNGDPNYTSISEVELRKTVGGADVTTPGTPVTASSYVTDPLAPPYFVVDNIHPSFGWISAYGFGGINQWLRFDLLTPTEIRSVAISSSNTVGNIRAPMRFRIEGSNDGVNFATLQSFISTGWGISETRVFNL